jgi:NAD(P)-dependent dehydrogenase (short-subunit alcohol dehydrogenase family)
MRSFRDKTAIVTGGGSGIGRELALALAGEGSHVVITDIVQERIDEVLRQLEDKGVKAGGYRVDHASLDETRAFAEQYGKEWGPVDVLCCNAGVGHGARLEDTSLEEWQWVLGVNLWGVVYMIHFFVPGMIERRQGSVLITASAAGIMPLPAMAPYNVTKAAVVSLAETLRMELVTHNIGVTALCPGVINTSIVRDGKIRFSEGQEETIKSNLVEFYATKGTDPAVVGTDPAVVARDGLWALKRDVGIMPTPLNVWPLYLLHRISPPLYQWLGKYLWKKGRAFFLPVFPNR